MSSNLQFSIPWAVADGLQQTIVTADKGSGGRSNHPRPADYNSPTTRIESTVSIGTSKQIQQHLDSGNAIYFGVDPRDRSRIRRDTTQRSEILARRLREFRRSSGGGGGGDARKSLLSKALCGLSLDNVAKITLVVGLYLGAHLCLTGITAFLARRVNREGLSALIAVLQIVWGAYFAGVCIFGMSLMWGKFRRSPTAALFFTTIWAFTTFIILLSAGLFFYLFHSVRSVRISNCRASTVPAGPRLWGGDLNIDQEAPRRSAPKDRIEACIARTMTRGTALLVYAIAHLFVALLALVVVDWARDYHARLRTVEKFGQLQERYHCEDEKVGLVIGTVPIGMRSPRPPGPPATPASRPRTSLTDMFGVLPISVRRSELYAAAGPSPSWYPSPPPSPMPPLPVVVREGGSVVSNVRVW